MEDSPQPHSYFCPGIELLQPEAEGINKCWWAGAPGEHI